MIDRFRRSLMFTIGAALIVLASINCGSSSGGKHDPYKDAKAAFTLSAHLYDFAMTSLGDAYRAGQLSEDGKLRSLQIANQYLGAARAMKEFLDQGPQAVNDALANYTALYNAIKDLWDLLPDKAKAARPMTLPRPESLNALVAHDARSPAFAWPVAATSSQHGGER